MNIAFCWFGEYRNADIALKFNKFQELRNNHNVIDFISTWNQRISFNAPEYDIIPDSYKHEIITKNNFENLIDTSNCYIHDKIKIERTVVIKEKNSTVNSMIYHLKYLTQCVSEYDLKFDLLIFMRLDTIYHLDFKFLNTHNFNNSIIVESVKRKSDKSIYFIHDFLFISTFYNILSFINNLKYDSKEVCHNNWANIINELNIDIIPLENINKQNRYNIIVRYKTRKYFEKINRIEELNHNTIIYYKNLSGKPYKEKKII